MLVIEGSHNMPVNGDEERVFGEDAELYADSVKECSSAAVASRDPSNSPLCERFSS